MDFGRVITAMVTPFDENLEVDYQKARELAIYLAENGSDGIVVAGTTGESPTLTKEEKIKLFQVVVEAVRGKARVIAGTGSNSTKESIEMTKAANECGVDGIMLVVPYYNKPPQEGLYNHFKAVAEVTSKPVMLYNVPGRTACNLLPETVAKLAEIHNIVAIKEASGNLEQVENLRKIVPADFIIYSGDDSLTLPILSLGGHGIVSVAAHVIGKEMQTMIREYLEGNTSSAQDWHERLTPMFKNLFITSNPILVKAAMNLLGHNVGSVRLPLIGAKDSEIEIIKDTLKEMNKI